MATGFARSYISGGLIWIPDRSTLTRPSITSVTSGDGTLTLAITAANASDVVYARYKTTTGAWSAQSEIFKRTGSGNITLTGLTNGTRYTVGAYVSLDGIHSDWAISGGTPAAGTVTPTGMYSLPLHYLKVMMSKSESFQEFVNANDDDEALLLIHKVDFDFANGSLPCAIVDWGERMNRMAIATGTHNQFFGQGDLVACFMESVTSTDYEAAADSFMNEIGNIVKDMEALSGQAGYLNFVSTSCGRPQRVPEEEKDSKVDTSGALIGDYYFVFVTFGYSGI